MLICTNDIDGLSIPKGREDKTSKFDFGAKQTFKDTEKGIYHNDFTTQELADIFGVHQQDDDGKFAFIFKKYLFYRNTK